MTDSGTIKFELFFDYGCPFVYRMARLLAAVGMKRDLQVEWRYFSLTQVNSRDHGPAVWAAPHSSHVKGRLAFEAAEAARRQGKFDAMHMALLEARHSAGLDLDSDEVIEKVAAGAGLDMNRFQAEMGDPHLVDALARDHQHAVGELGVFGTPTLVFANARAAYVRLARNVDPKDAVEVFDRLVSVAGEEPRILEIKRPVKPAPM
ncbi:MAG TPA: DsbA family protein [Candidatus Dormibacteraeota bacterium]|nr:DsbA family protein [Candidatus Dormibacteraeota bacterium]